MKKYTYIEPDEAITGLTKKIKSITDDEIRLVLPGKSKMASIASLRQLREQVKKIKKKVIIISNDKNVLKNAREAGFLTQISGKNLAKKAKSKSKSSTPGSKKNIKIVYKKKPADDHPKPTPKIKTTSQKIKNSQPPSLANQILLGALAIVSIIIIVAVVFLIIPTTQIDITSQVKTVDLETSLTIDSEQKNVDYINNVIPAQLINSSQEYVQEERATGSTNNGQPASGVITVHNSTSSELSLVANTRFLSSSNILFRSNQAVKVPANGAANVSVTADIGGTEGNIGPSRFTLPALPGSESYLYGESTASMSGGTDDIIYSISEEDIAYSTDSLREKIYDQAVEDIKTKLPANREFITLDLNQIDIAINADHEVGDQVETFNIIAQANVPFIVYDESHLREIVSKNLAKMISQDRTMADQGMENLSIDIVDLDVPSGYALLKINTEAVSIPDYNLEKIKRDLTGKTGEEVKEYFLDYPEIQQIDITFWPDWVNRVSKIPARIDINITW